MAILWIPQRLKIYNVARARSRARSLCVTYFSLFHNDFFHVGEGRNLPFRHRYFQLVIKYCRKKSVNHNRSKFPAAPMYTQINKPISYQPCRRPRVIPCLKLLPNVEVPPFFLARWVVVWKFKFSFPSSVVELIRHRTLLGVGPSRRTGYGLNAHLTVPPPPPPPFVTVALWSCSSF